MPAWRPVPSSGDEEGAAWRPLPPASGLAKKPAPPAPPIPAPPVPAPAAQPKAPPTAAAPKAPPVPARAAVPAGGKPPPSFSVVPGGIAAPTPQTATSTQSDVVKMGRVKIEQAKRLLHPLVIRRMDIAAAVELPRADLQHQLDEMLRDLLVESRLQLNRAEQTELLTQILDDMLGLGPIEPLLRDETVTDIMVNGPKQVYVETKGKLQLTDVIFDDNAHLLNICNRIVSKVGRRVDESSPICDARLLDGSRVNIIIPPLAIDGPSVSIRKFSKKSIDFDQMAASGNMSPQMATVLRIASRVRMNIVISGGTGSGKTTLLNALSGMIGHDERIVTIEDAAELKLQQPHVVRLETRPPNLEGNGEISMRDLVKNALRMRPERIILGEVRGPEAVDLLQAMNTGHDGSMGTLHANRPREAVTRLENMMAMANLNLPVKALRTQIAGAVNMIVQIQRMRDGMRRITHITEITGMEGEVITTQDLFTYEFKGEGPDGKLVGTFKSSGLRPNFLAKAAYYGLDRAVMEAMG
ncbi:MAG: CpaF family protein [Alphaproteobacteria bacterium]|nr:CpaF family protein [Alphaproteobacteria bacterium]MCW5744173.1 CpaF family protein [Alphaproteobacteria bacterium]